MLYVIICTDKSDSGDLRVDNREIHLDYLKSKDSGRYTDLIRRLGLRK